MGSLLEYIEEDEDINKRTNLENINIFPESIYLTSYNHKGINCEKLLASFGLQETEIIKIVKENTSREIKTIIYDIEKIYENYKNYGITPYPNIGTYIYETLISGKEKTFEH